jgi:hypothetical protein
MVRRQAGEPAPQRPHFRRAVEPKQLAERGRISFLEMFGPFDARQASVRASATSCANHKSWTDFTI